MINSLTNHEKNNITLDKILVKGQQTSYISTDAHEVTKKVEKHYKEAFKTRNSNFNQLSKDWKEEYSPKATVKEEWFSKLMDPVTEEELNKVLKDLPNGKASGISTISYEMLKKLGTGARRVIRGFYSLCLEKGSCPHHGKQAPFFLYPKQKTGNVILQTLDLLFFLRHLENASPKSSQTGCPLYAKLIIS